jgi:hypothetical protein
MYCISHHHLSTISTTERQAKHIKTKAIIPNNGQYVHSNTREGGPEMDAILGYSWFDVMKVYQIVCITNEKPNHIKPVQVSAVSGYPVGEV